MQYSYAVTPVTCFAVVGSLKTCEVLLKEVFRRLYTKIYLLDKKIIF